MTKNKPSLLTFAEIEGNGEFPLFKSDKERIKYVTEAYKKMNLAKAFGIFYNIEEFKSQEKKYAKSIVSVENIVIGNVYLGTVGEFQKNLLTFNMPGVKEEIICKDNFNACINNVETYLLNHDNKLLFEVREKKNNKYYVSVISAYYRLWTQNINQCIKNNTPINVHIDELVRGGYMCHLNIDTLCDLTGQNYTHLAFIPGSQIVLNIENDFDKWVGQDVNIIPQNFVDYFKNYKTGEVQKSLVGSRKKLLNINGMNNMADIYSKWKLVNSDNVKGADIEFDGVVTGVINSRDITGVFVELEGQYITGLLPIDPIDLLDYKAGDNVHVKVDKFDIQEGQDPFIYSKNGRVIKSNTRIIFKL